MLLPLIFGACGEVHAVDIASLDTLANTDNPTKVPDQPQSINSPRFVTYCSTSGHCSQQTVVNLYHLLHSLTGNPVSSRGS